MFGIHDPCIKTCAKVLCGDADLLTLTSVLLLVHVLQFSAIAVLMYNYLWPTGISGEKVEIDPVATKGSMKFLRQKAVTYDADTIASCDVVEEKSSGDYVHPIHDVICEKMEYGHHCVSCDCLI